MSEQPGEWVTPEVNYVDPERRFCAYCGRPIARRYWRVSSHAGESAAYCSPEHAALDATYPYESPNDPPGP
ncbi:MAG: hypothetical protein KC442_14555 [Thermomicrobiales bacterium]|nr:hypothetical protein [Thermomicrobiales bacterium]